ncbi:hypothetical protein [Streptomyces sp. NPDC008125]|uniref:hypothetical protein n=1 Tax=Streptomyces sp. NPDC008125 TaxID=3364811 RepID=UPI0036EB43EF
MTFNQIQPDTRVVCHSRGEIKGTVLAKNEAAFGEDHEAVLIMFDGGALGWNWPTQLSPLDEPAPTPKLLPTSTKAVKQFYTGGRRYRVLNAAAGARGYWEVIRDGAALNADDDVIVSRCATRRAAFEAALAKLAAG